MVPRVLDPKMPRDVGALAQRQRIVEAMVDSCAEKTYAATTIADIVSRASISRTTFYKRFADKRECFDAAVDYCIEQIRVVAAAAHTTADPPAQAVPKATAAILGLMVERPSLARVVAGEAVTVEPAVVDRYRRLMIPAVEAVWDAAGVARDGHMDPRLAFGRAQLLVFNEIAAGRPERLAELLPEIVYLAMAPFAGHEEALEQARRATDRPPASAER